MRVKYQPKLVLVVRPVILVLLRPEYRVHDEQKYILYHILVYGVAAFIRGFDAREQNALLFALGCRYQLHLEQLETLNFC